MPRSFTTRPHLAVSDAMKAPCSAESHAHDLGAITGREQSQQKGLFDHLVGADKQSGWHGKTQYLRGLEIDDQLDFGGLLDR